MEGETELKAKANAPSPSSQEVQVVRLDELGYFIRMKRTKSGLTLEQASEQCGVSAATLSRLERQYTARTRGDTNKAPPMPDMRTISAVTSWLGVVLDGVKPVDAIETDHEVEEPTIEKIAAHLRADRKLNPESAALITRLIEAIYKEYTPEEKSNDAER